MTPTELRVCRSIVKSLMLRLSMLRARLRKDIVHNDCFCLDLSGAGCSIDEEGNAVSQANIGRRITEKCLTSDAAKFASFENCLRVNIAQVMFADTKWIDGDVLSNARGELDAIMEAVIERLMMVARDVVRRRLKVALAWDAVSKVYDTITKGAPVTFALKVVRPVHAAPQAAMMGENNE